MKQCRSDSGDSDVYEKLHSGLPIYSKRLTNKFREEKMDWQETLFDYGQSLSRKDILSSIVNGTIIFWSILLVLSLAVAGFMRYGLTWITKKVNRDQGL